MEPKSPSKFKLSLPGFAQYRQVLKISAISLVALLFLVGVYFVFELGKDRNFVRNGYYYTVVVDCGSTGTRVNVYNWKRGSLGSWDLPILMNSYPNNSTKSSYLKGSCKYHCMQTEPGLDKFVGNATGVRVSLEPLILWAEKLVPYESHGDTPIFVLATAGLRRLQMEDARQVLDDVEDVIKEHSFIYSRDWIRVLSGKEEAYYGWVALNYKMGSLVNSSKGSTLGLLDLGGSSLQVVMEADGGTRDYAHLIRSKIGFVEHDILAYSLPSFGLNEAFDRTVAMLNEVQPVTGGTSERLKLRHSCLSSGFVQNYTCYACNGLSIAHQKNLSSQMHKIEYINLAGDPNWEQCRGFARAAATNSSSLNWSQPTVANNCRTVLSSYGSNTLNVTVDTHSTKRFHALSGFYIVYNMLNLGPKADFAKIKENGQLLCSKSWADLTSTSGIKNYIGHYCFRVLYMASLIEEALCLGDKEIVFGPGDLSWTLGAALVEGDYLWLSNSKTGTSSLKSMEAIHSPIFVFLLLTCLLFVVYCSQVKLPVLGKKKAPVVGLSLASYTYLNRRPN